MVFILLLELAKVVFVKDFNGLLEAIQEFLNNLRQRKTALQLQKL